ncbi:MAG: ATP-dependent helicase, partial [Candidatus Methanomethylophilaceae archaeon]|nr:ATP-dependent helicase [Candidatus Methanomethylophilaceae archaeon]
ESNPEFREWMKTQVTVMAIDEAQDLTELNYLILDRLIEIIPSLKVFLVGDPRQNIFEFNGGSYKNLYEFLSRHPGYALKTLTITYRCGQPISDFVNRFQFDDCENYQLQPVKSQGQLVVWEARSEDDEANRVLKGILSTGNINSCAVLSNNLRYLGPFIQTLQLESIPYRVFGGQRVLKRHIRFLNHILRIIDCDNAYSIRKIAQYAGIDINRNGKKSKSRFYESDLGKIIQAIREGNAPFSQTAYRVITEIMSGPDDKEEITADYNAFLELSAQFGTTSDYLAAFATDRERFSSFYMADYEECPVPTDQGFLTISTIHSAKGLEWDNVFIMGLCEGNFPNPFFCQNLSPQEQQEFFNNEWKKMYVAATRARKNLYLTYSANIKRKGYSFHKAPSRFITNQLPA